MKTVRWIQASIAISLFGAVFSGGLTYRELFAGAAKCPSPGAPGTVFGYPACVYGFVMYTALVMVGALALRAARRETRPQG
jgi:uncharacterized membrane protein